MRVAVDEPVVPEPVVVVVLDELLPPPQPTTARRSAMATNARIALTCCRFPKQPSKKGVAQRARAPMTVNSRLNVQPFGPAK